MSSTGSVVSPPTSPAQSRPFEHFSGATAQSALRAAITAATRRAEPECVGALLPEARLPPGESTEVQALAAGLARTLREKGGGSQVGLKQGLVQGLVQEFSLSSQEGVALMCLAEALLRIPDTATRDALIRDKIGAADWGAHLGRSRSLFVNAATWGLLLTGRLVATHTERGLASALGRIVARSGEPLIRRGVDMAMRLMGEQFVTGETISEALANSRAREAQGFRYSYDMLGEAAMTDADALRYYAAYEGAIHAIGAASAGRGIYAGPGISIKLSALHPRYSRAQRERALTELYPRLRALALLARSHDIGLNIDAEEADRLELSLDLLEKLCAEPALAGWNGVGFVVQAYQKRAPFVLDWIIDLARRGRRRLMVRLVKGAYWDAEIKRAQVDGLPDFPVYTRKVHTDVAYLACARRLLAAPDAVYPQFATHNAHTVAAVARMAAMAGAAHAEHGYEFQCLHGMGEPLYEQVVAPAESGGLARSCRIYAPVGTHETLLAYLVRRLLENGANSSFVNRIGNDAVPIEELVADPVALVERNARDEGVLGQPHPAISGPRELYARDVLPRSNSAGLDLADEHELAMLQATLAADARHDWRAAPVLHAGDAAGQPLRNPADRRDVVGHVVEATADDAAAAVAMADAALAGWRELPVAERAALLEAAAERLEGDMPRLMGLIMREAGKTAANAIGEVREAVDFLNYYAAQARAHVSDDAAPLGPVVCISPWNFPLAIFTGQVAAALAAGNTVLAKPAEQTPLIAAQAVALLHEAGVPRNVLQLVPGPGETVGAALVADARTRAVLFTGSTAVARAIQASLAGRLDEQGRPLTLVAETGGQNAMIVDSSALPEQVVADVLASSFDSAGQRCSALRVLCVQADVADRVLPMLEGALRELRVGRPDRLAVDVGPVIDEDARRGIAQHIEAMQARGRRVLQPATLDAAVADGCFVPPTLIEIDSLGELQREVFGPVLHVLRYARDELPALIDAINATGYGLTLGIHSRIDETIDAIVARARAGNLYVNRNMIGAVVGVQPFGGEGLSGTGPKAGGPLYLRRLLREPPPFEAGTAIDEGAAQQARSTALAPLRALRGALGAWASSRDDAATAPAAAVVEACDSLLTASPVGTARLLPGPTGERNTWALVPRDAIFVIADERDTLLFLTAHVLAAGAQAVWPDDLMTRALHVRLIAAAPLLRERCVLAPDPQAAAVGAAVVQGSAAAVMAWTQRLARREGPIVALHAVPRGALQAPALPLERLMLERTLSINTTAAGGNATLMTIG